MVMKKTDLGLFPIDWSVSDWSSVLDGFTSGATPSRAIKDYFKGNIRWITSGELNYNIIIGTIEHISKDAVKQTNLTVHPAGTFLMAITGLEAEGTRGSCGIIGKESTTNQSCLAIYGTSRLMIPYLFYFYVKYGDWLAKHYCQGTKQQSYTASLVKQLPIIYPPSIEEQRCITEVLSDVDNLISSLQKLIEKKKAIKQGALQELLTGKKRLPGFSVEWSQAPFGDLFDFLPTNAFTRDQMTDTGTIQNVHYGDILTKYGACLDMANTDVPYLLETVSVRKYSESSYVREGDVIIADTAEDSTVGKCVELVNVHGKVLSGQHTMLCRPKVTFAPKFLGYYMNAGCFHNQMLPFITGIKVSSISKANISTLVLKYPTLVEEQQAIAQVFSDIDEEIAQLEKKLAKYQQIKQGMMQELLTGRIRLKEGENNA